MIYGLEVGVKNMGNKVKVDEDILGCALRYALPRKTYICGVVSEAIIDNLDNLSPKCVHVMARDIDEAFEWGKVSNYDCDIQIWQDLRSRLKILDNINKSEVVSKYPKPTEAECPNCGTVCTVQYSTEKDKDGNVIPSSDLSYITCCNSSYVVAVRGISFR